MRDIEIDIILNNATKYEREGPLSPGSFKRKSFYSKPLTRSWEEDKFHSMRYLDNPVRTAMAKEIGTTQFDGV